MKQYLNGKIVHHIYIKEKTAIKITSLGGGGRSLQKLLVLGTLATRLTAPAVLTLALWALAGVLLPTGTTFTTAAVALTALAVLTLTLTALAASRLSTLAGALAAAAGLLAGAVVTTGAWVTVLAGHCYYYFLLMCICICIRLLHFFFEEISYEEYSN